MVAQVYTVAFEGVEARPVEVQCAVTAGLPAFSIVGLPDKAVSEARDRVRTALSSMAIALPSKRITINLSPADLPKEGSHFDLPIAMALLAALDILPKDMVEETLSLGELSLDGSLVPVIGALPAAMAAAEAGRALLCPRASGAEAAWVGAAQVIAAASLADVVRHFSGQGPLPPAEPGEVLPHQGGRDLRDVKGQERAKRAMEIAAAGRHHLFMVGTPGFGEIHAGGAVSLDPAAADRRRGAGDLDDSFGGGLLDEGGISRCRPFREPHHTASMPAIVGGGRRVSPGEISLAHNGVLFLDEFPEFPRQVLETLRQPLETGEVMVARANAHVKYPCRFLLVAAANPCKCGYLSDPSRACARVPQCGEDYLGRISGPLMDRLDLRIEVPPVAFTDLDLPAKWRQLCRGGRAGRSRAGGATGAVCRPRQPCATMPMPKARPWRKSRRPMRRAGRCLSKWRSGSGFPPGGITGRCGWRAPSPIWTSRNRCAARMWPRRSVSA